MGVGQPIPPSSLPPPTPSSGVVGNGQCSSPPTGQDSPGHRLQWYNRMFPHHVTPTACGQAVTVAWNITLPPPAHRLYVSRRRVAYRNNEELCWEGRVTTLLTPNRICLPTRELEVTRQNSVPAYNNGTVLSTYRWLVTALPYGVVGAGHLLPGNVTIGHNNSTIVQ